MKYLMIIVVPFRELFKKIPKPRNLGNLFFMFIFPPALLLFIGWISLAVLQIILAITFIVIVIVILVLPTIGDSWNKEFIMMIVMYIISGVVFLNSVQIKTISESKNVNLTENTIEYKGFTKDVTYKRENCKTKKYNLKHYSLNLYGISQESISVTCVKAPKKVQEIKEIN